MNSDVLAYTRTSTGTLVSGRSRLRQIVVNSAGTGSPSITLKDGGASGDTLLTMTFPVSGSFSVNIPANGIVFTTDIHITIVACDGVTAFVS